MFYLKAKQPNRRSQYAHGVAVVAGTCLDFFCPLWLWMCTLVCTEIGTVSASCMRSLLGGCGWILHMPRGGAQTTLCMVMHLEWPPPNWKGSGFLLEEGMYEFRDVWILWIWGDLGLLPILRVSLGSMTMQVSEWSCFRGAKQFRAMTVEQVQCCPMWGNQDGGPEPDTWRWAVFPHPTNPWKLGEVLSASMIFIMTYQRSLFQGSPWGPCTPSSPAQWFWMGRGLIGGYHGASTPILLSPASLLAKELSLRT